ncbi:MAG: WecB/TagA/CpsF family glycosyltransferase [Sporolactobacillus sp.]
MNDKQWLGNIQLNTYTRHQEVLHDLQRHLVTRNTVNLFFLNDHAFNIAQHDLDYLNILNTADLLVNDGLGVKLGAKLWGIALEENLNGTDLIPRLLDICAANGWSIYLLGAAERAVHAAAENLQQRYPDLIIAGWQNGYFTNENEVVQAINSSRADVLLVGMGMPRQEKFINRQHHALQPVLRIAVGGYIDFASGLKPRAPLVMRRLNLEWLFRMALEPRRMWRRNIIGHLQFFIKIIRLKKQ